MILLGQILNTLHNYLIGLSQFEDAMGVPIMVTPQRAYNFLVCLHTAAIPLHRAFTVIFN